MLTKSSTQLLLLLFFTLLSSSIFAQSKVTGKVTGPDQKPLVGASVTVKGTNTGVTTIDDGSFSITVPAATKVLVISNVGYDEQEVNIANQSNVMVVLQPNATSVMLTLN